MSLHTPIRRIPVVSNELGVDLVDEVRALQMRRHSPQYVRLKRDKRTREIVTVFLDAPTLTHSDWREPHVPASSTRTIKREPLDRDASHECLECVGPDGYGRHGGLQRGPHSCFAHKGKVITREWMRIRDHEMGPLYRVKHL